LGKLQKQCQNQHQDAQQRCSSHHGSRKQSCGFNSSQRSLNGVNSVNGCWVKGILNPVSFIDKFSAVWVHSWVTCHGRYSVNVLSQWRAACISCATVQTTSDTTNMQIATPALDRREAALRRVANVCNGSLNVVAATTSITMTVSASQTTQTTMLHTARMGVAKRNQWHING